MRSSFEKEIQIHGKLIYTCHGNSMMPLLHEKKDILIIEKVTNRLRKYDIPLYKRENGQYVLHRILKVREGDYVICGDNRWQLEYGVSDKQIIGVLTSFIRDGKKYSLKDKKYKVYAHLWCDLYWVRVFFLKVLSLVCRLDKKRAK